MRVTTHHCSEFVNPITAHTMIVHLLLLTLVAPVLSHEHHHLTEGDKAAPVDSILWIHIGLQIIVFGCMFPIGMVLGLTKSRWHVPLQVMHASQSSESRC